VRELERNGIRPWLLNNDWGVTSDDVSFVISVGGDGTLLRASHSIPMEIPLISINSDPAKSVGHLCQFLPADLQKAVSAIKTNEYDYKTVTRMEVHIGGRVVHKRVLNEALFSHACPAAMTQFSLMADHEDPERYRCSGVWIGTGAGSTGALGSAGAEHQELGCPFFQAVVREPYGVSPIGPRTLRAGIFQLQSETNQATLYIDGPYLQIPVRYGDFVSFQDGESLKLVTQ
jgi:NAD+ kinase